jgi:hypothetical protein
MLVRICLILAIVAGLGALGISHFMVRENLNKVIEDRNTTREARDKFKKGEEEAKAEGARLKAELETTQGELTSTKTQLTEANNRADTAQAAAEKAKTDLANVSKQRAQLAGQVKQWEGLGTFEQVEAKVTEFPKLKEALEVAATERKILDKQLTKANAELADLKGLEVPPPELPIGLKGKIVSVDPKFNFVVLDIGGNQGVLERGELLINRKGKLIGKVRVRTVEPDRCIANIIPAWAQGEPFEGDEVLY